MLIAKKKKKVPFCLSPIPYTSINFHVFPAKPNAARQLAPCYHGGRDPQETGISVKNVDYLPEIWVISYFCGQRKILTKSVQFELIQKALI